jgi:branched-chain amino acid transport system substrate-binding protein
MFIRIGVLLPRSTDYPSIGFDILDGLRSYFKQAGKEVQFISENIGYGDDSALNYSRAEKLILQDEVQLVIAYSNPRNAEPFYSLSNSTQRPFILLDAGVQHPEVMQQPYAFHISLQGMEAAYISGWKAAEGGKNILKATSFYDGGYRAPWAVAKGVEENNGKICGNYVSPFKIADFNIGEYMDLLQSSGAEAVCASFSTYLAELFMSALKQNGAKAVSLPFYCSSFMAEEQLLHKMEFPGGTFNTVIPWSSLLQNEAQHLFMETIKTEKKKTATIFHLLGWEAGIVTAHLLESETIAPDALKNWSFESPRGKQTFHPDTHYSYGPLYNASIVEGEAGKCALVLHEPMPADAGLHTSLLTARLENTSDWKNNYLCI